MKRLFVMLFLFSAHTAAWADRPNILWLSCEDISPHLGCYGYPKAKTPVLDQLAREGVRYRHATVAAGVCAPCRSTIITGMYHTTIGTHHMRSKAVLPEQIKLFPSSLRKAGYYCTNHSKTDYQLSAPKDTWDSGKGHWKNRKEGQPFFAVFNYTGCHESGIASQGKYRSVTARLPPEHRQDPKALELPPYYPDTPVVREDWKRYYEVISAMDQWAGEHLQALKDAGLYENTIVIYWSDHGVGLPRAKRWLYDSGMRVPLIVRIPEKFRVDGQGKPGTVEDELVSLMDLGPTTLNLAGLPVPGLMQGRAFLGANRAEERPFVFGCRDRMDERYDIIRAVRDQRYKYIRNYEAFKPYYQYMNTPEKGATMREIRRVQAEGSLPPAAALFTAASKPQEEFYDLEKDPHEINNRIDDPAFAEQVEKMRQAHLDWVLETRDIGLIPEPEIELREKQAGSRYAILAGDDSGLIQRLRDTAGLALKGPEALERMQGAFKDPDAAVRYWAAIAIGNQGAKGTSASELMRQGLGDSSTVVRIACARALALQGNAERALPLLRKELSSPEQWSRLHAAIVLDEMDDAAKPAVPELKKALKKQPNKYIVRVANRALNEMLGTNNTVP